MKKIKLFPIRIAIEYIISLAFMFAIPGRRDDLIVDYGIHSYQNLVTASKVLLGIVVVTSVVEILLYIRKTKKRQQQLEMKIKEEVEKKNAARRKEAVLSVRGKMDTEALHQMLSTAAQREWSILAGSLHECEKDMYEVNELQNKLQRLLKHNDAEALKNSEEVLDRVEQYICRTIRKVLNYMEVSDAKNEEEVKRVKSKLLECHLECREQLARSQDFLYALTDFLNKQGEDSCDTDMIDIYKNAILESLEESL